MRRTFGLIIFFWFFLGLSAFNPGLYSKSQNLTSDYIVYWTISPSSNINIALSVRTIGWIGFGLAEPTSGSMPGADFFIAQWTEENKLVEGYDHYAIEKAKPILDKCDDWKVISTERNTESGFTVVEISRKLDTGDPQDRPILAGPTRVLWSYGSKNEISYHGALRGPSFIEFIPNTTPNPPLSDVIVREFRMPNIAVPAKVTNYICLSFPAPVLAPDEDYHIVKFETLVDPRNIEYVHHLLFHSCSLTNSSINQVRLNLNASSCHSPLGYGGCYGVAYSWAVGGSPLIVPEEAGYRIGASSNAIKWFILEIHYNNVNEVSDIVDSSGVRISFTRQLRKYDAGTLMFGNVGVDEDDIPSGNPGYRVQAACPQQCTQQWPHNITVFGDFLHMHNYGKMIWSTIYQNEERIPGYLNRVEYWQFEFQDFVPLKRVIEPGDTINTICIYDTSRSDQSVNFGISSNEEMCLEFLAYYPRLTLSNGHPFGFCGSKRGRYHLNNDGTISDARIDRKRNFLTICGQVDTSDILWDPSNYSLNNPVISEPWGDEARTFGIDSADCRLPEPQPEGNNRLVIIVLASLLGISLVVTVILGIKLYSVGNQTYHLVE